MKYKAPDTKYETLAAYADGLRALVQSGHALDVVKLAPNKWGRRVVQEFGIYDKFPIYIEAKPIPFIRDLRDYGFTHTASNPYDRKYKERLHKLLHTDGAHIELHVRGHPIATELIPARADLGYVGDYNLDAKLCWPMDDDGAKMSQLIFQVAKATISLCEYLVQNNVPACVDQAGGWNHTSDKDLYTVWNPPPGHVPNLKTRKLV